MADSTVDIDPGGDVVLVCGQSDMVKRLRVSAGALSLGSPVFKTMLGPSFKEGKQLSEQGTLDLPLPDDNGEDMAIICDILHLRHSNLSRRLEVKKLEDISILADKYSCTLALGPIAEHWVKELSKDCDDRTRASLICSAFRLRLPLMFKELGRDHILRCKDGVWPLDGDRPEHNVLQRVFDAADSKEARVRGELTMFFDGKVISYCDANRKSPKNCLRALQYGTGVIRKLNEAKLWPLYNNQALSVGAMLAKMAAIEWNLVMPSSSNCDKDYSRCFCGQGVASTNETLTSLFKAEAEKIAKDIPDLCLGCVLEGESWRKTACDHPQGSSSPFGL